MTTRASIILSSKIYGMISGVTFNDEPSLHDVMRDAGRCFVTVIRIQIDTNTIIPTTEQALFMLDLDLLDLEYISHIIIYFDYGTNIEQFQKVAISQIKAKFNSF